jgi:hypothetical protein
LLTGQWATIAFRPDLGSQQEFIVGVAASIDGDVEPHVKWLPSLAKLGHLYGESISSSDTRSLLEGSDRAMRSSFRKDLSSLDSGTPHLRVVPCGYIATDDINVELTRLLKRHASAIWQDTTHKGSPMDDDWAYATMIRTLKSLQEKHNPFVPGRSIVIANKSVEVGLDNGSSYGNVVSARYASFSTVQAHIHSSLLQVNIAHKLSNRESLPAMFVILPEPTTSVEVVTAKKTMELLSEIEDAGISQFCHQDPNEVALKIQNWAIAI